MLHFGIFTLMQNQLLLDSLPISTEKKSRITLELFLTNNSWLAVKEFRSKLITAHTSIYLINDRKICLFLAF